MLQTKGPTLVAEYWRKSSDCVNILEDPNPYKILKSINLLDLLVWVGDNGYMLCLFETGFEPDTYEPSQIVDDLCSTDINIVGDASPSDTLWFVFKESEWSILDTLFNYDITGYLKSIWSACEEDAKEDHAQSNQWAFEALEHKPQRYNPKIINADISVTLPTKGETNEITSDR